MISNNSSKSFPQTRDNGSTRVGNIIMNGNTYNYINMTDNQTDRSSDNFLFNMCVYSKGIVE